MLGICDTQMEEFSVFRGSHILIIFVYQKGNMFLFTFYIVNYNTFFILKIILVIVEGLNSLLAKKSFFLNKHLALHITKDSIK